MNKYIRELAERLRDERPIGYFCECGCMGTAPATVSHYDTQGAPGIEGHGRA